MIRQLRSRIISLLAGMVLFLCVFALPAAIITLEFRGDGEGPTSTAAIEDAVKNAEDNAASQGYSDCQLKKIVYYPDTVYPTWYASAWMDCTKDTTPPPPPPPHTYTPPTIFTPIREGVNHTVKWQSTEFSRFALQQQINSGSWREIYKGSNTSWTAYNPGPNTYSYRVYGIAGDGGATSSVVSITVSNPPSVPSLVVPPTVVRNPYHIAWSASPNADQYILERGLPGGGWESAYVGPSTAWSVQNASPGDYVYRVKACQNFACSEPSSAQSYLVRVTDSVITNYILDN